MIVMRGDSGPAKCKITALNNGKAEATLETALSATSTGFPFEKSALTKKKVPRNKAQTTATSTIMLMDTANKEALNPTT